MLATAPAPRTSAATICPPVIRTDLVLPRTVTVQGRVCSSPTLSWTITGVAVAHFLLECNDLPDPRLRRLAHRASSVIDVTVWGPDAAFVADGPPRGFRQRLNNEAAKAGEPQRWNSSDDEREFPPPIRRNVRVVVEGTPRAGMWYPIGFRGRPLPLGLVTEGLPRVTGSAVRD